MSSTPPRGSSDAERPPAVLVGVQLQGVSDEALASSLSELERLADTLGLRVIGRVTQKRQGLGASNVLGDGKLKELAQYTGGPGFVAAFARPGSRGAAEADSASNEETDLSETETPQAVTVLMDQDLSPSQIGHEFFTRGREMTARAFTIGETKESIAKKIPTATLFEVVRGQKSWQENFLSSSLIHLFANDSFDLAKNT